MSQAVEVKIGDKQYLGILHSAPDVKEDNHIIITSPHLLVKDKKGVRYEKMELVKSMIVKFDQIEQISSYKKTILKSNK